jgi:hypothetical protein
MAFRSSEPLPFSCQMRELGNKDAELRNEQLDISKDGVSHHYVDQFVVAQRPDCGGPFRHSACLSGAAGRVPRCPCGAFTSARVFRQSCIASRSDVAAQADDQMTPRSAEDIDRDQAVRAEIERNKWLHFLAGVYVGLITTIMLVCICGGFR